MIFSSYSEQNESLAGMTLISCGHIFAEPERVICRPQGRSDWLLFYVAKGKESFFLDKKRVAEAGDFVIFAPNEKQHHINEGSRTAEFYYVHFQCDSLPDGISLNTSQIYSFEHHNSTAAIFEEIIEETLQKRPHYEILCISRLLQLLSIIQREAAQLNHSSDKQWRSVANAITHMNRNCESNLRLEDYAAMCCMSKYHFTRVFKQVTGVTPLDYRNGIRIESAKELLQNGFLSVSEISESLGYSSPAYFSDIFKKSVGVSPRKFREEHT